jgi:3-hydroxyisobutyrate dehydrogenase-like beta-hydroxyacid dehydrogenase
MQLACTLACAGRSGVAPQAFVEVLAKGGAGGTALERVRPYLLARDPSGLRFSVANAHKDLGYYTTMAADAGAQREIAAAVFATLELGLQRGGAGALMPELVSLLDPATQ